MLCLRQQVCRHIPGIGAVIRQHQNLAWPGNAVNAHMSIDRLLCQSHENIARAGDLVHFRNRFCSESQSCNSLGAAYLISIRYPCQMCRCQRYGIHLSVLSRRRHHYNPLHSCHLCRNNIHQHRRRIGCLSSRHIHPHTGQWCYLLPQYGAVWPAVKPTVLLLLLMIFPDVVHGFFHHGKQGRLHQGKSLLNLLLRHPKLICCQLHSVKFPGVFQKRLVPAVLHILHNFLNLFLIAAVMIRIPL